MGFNAGRCTILTHQSSVVFFIHRRATQWRTTYCGRVSWLIESVSQHCRRFSAMWCEMCTVQPSWQTFCTAVVLRHHHRLQLSRRYHYPRPSTISTPTITLITTIVLMAIVSLLSFLCCMLLMLHLDSL